MASLLRGTPLAVLLLLITASVYWPGLGGGFLFDDFPNIVTNPKVHATELSFESMSRAADAYVPESLGRPLATMSFAVNHAIGGVDPFGYKLLNLIVHLINAVLVLFLVQGLLGQRPEHRGLSPMVAFAVAAAWAIHPLQVSSVLYIVQRMETLSLTFVLLGLLAYLKGRRLQIAGRNGWPWLLAAAVAAVAGFLSKETAALFPAYTLAVELTLLRFAASDSRTRRTLLWLYATGAAVAVLAFALWVLPASMAPAAYQFREFSLSERLLTQLRVLPMYLGQMLLPTTGSMTFYYDNFAISKGLLDPPATLLAGVLLLILACSALAFKKKMPLYSLGVLWFFAGHLLTSNVIPLELVFEHRNYFALLGICLALTELILRIPTPDGPSMVRAGVAIALLGLAVLTVIRAATWGDPLNLALAHAQSNPGSPRASNDLAMLYAEMANGDPDSPLHHFAMAEFEHGAQLPNASALADQGLILMAASSGQVVKDEWWARLIQKTASRPMSSSEQRAVIALVQHRDKLPLDDRRLAEVYESLAARNKLPGHFLATFGDHAISYLKDDDLANRMFRGAVERRRNDPEFIAHMVATLAGDGHIAQARRVLERATELGVVDPATFEIPEALRNHPRSSGPPAPPATDGSRD